MATKIKEVSAFEAKTRLSELLRETERGRSFIICRRGKAVAQLGPPPQESSIDFREILTAFQEIRKSVSEKIDIRELRDEGRRF